VRVLLQDPHIFIMKNYCPDLFTGMYVEKIDGSNVRLSHCCAAKNSAPTDSIDINHPDLQKSRQFFLDTGELPDSCAHCSSNEKHTGTSSRMIRYVDLVKKNSFSTDVYLKKLDYNCDNICNLKCIMCDGDFSSAWREDEVKLGRRLSAIMKKTKHNNLLQNSDISKLEKVYFNGGEPMMSRDHINVLTHIIQNGNPAATLLTYSTNGTCVITEEVSELWSKFASVKLLVSIDCVGTAFEYVRYPAKWELVEKNLLDFKQSESNKFRVAINASIGVHNILYYDELHNWCTEHNYEHMTLPVLGQLSALNFPLEHKDHLLDYLNKLPKSDSKDSLILLANSISSPSLSWINFLNRLDGIRNNSWKIELQKLHDLIK